MADTDPDYECPWVVYLNPPAAAPAAKSVAKPTGPGTKGAGDWFDPTAESYPLVLNELGFQTSPFEAPVDPKTGKVPMTLAEVKAWKGIK